MVRRERGFTLIEILVVITIIATLAGLVAALAPKMIAEGKKTTCMNNLKQLGGFLSHADAARTIKSYKGAAFLMQVADDLKNDELKGFICPGEEYDGTDRPDEGTEEFVAMYRPVEIPDGVEGRLTSYAGPIKWQAPKTGALKHETWLWGCDRCKDGVPHHEGISVLTSSGAVEFWKPEKIEGYDEELGEIIVGPNSPDKRLQRTQFYPDR